jgi:GNAT superfamily N-acetyltransferase
MAESALRDIFQIRPAQQNRETPYIDLLKQHKEKDFVNRILNPGIAPAGIPWEGGSVASHQMAAEVDENGNWYVFPTIVNQGGKLVSMPLYDAFDYARETGEYIPMPDMDSAINFSENYKTKAMQDFFTRPAYRPQPQQQSSSPSALRRLIPSARDRILSQQGQMPTAPMPQETFRGQAFNTMYDMFGGSSEDPARRAQATRRAEGLIGAGRFTADFTPIVSDALAIDEVRDAYRQGNYGTAAILGGATMLGMLPIVGDAASKAVRGAVEPRFIDTLPGRNELNYWVDGGQDAVERGFPEEPFILLDKLYIDPQNRGQKAARQVLKEGLQEMADQYPGMDVRLLAEPLDRSTNQSDLVRLYESVGFDVDNYQDGMSSIPMSMRLPSRPPASAAPSPLQGTLDMSQAARMQRAAEQGFNVNTPVYHGTAVDFKEFDPDRSFGSQFWSTTDKAAIEAGEVGAAGRGVIKEMFQRIKNPAGWAEYDKYSTDELIAKGYDGLALPDADGQITYVAFEPSQYRDVNAAFNPAMRDSANLMAGAAGATFGLSALRNIQREDEQSRIE